MERCAECGFEPVTVDPSNGADMIRSFGRKWQAPLTRFLPGEDGAAIVRTRPSESTWSPLEYAEHLRDVFALFERRITQIATGDRPVLEGTDPDEAARPGGDHAQDPATVAAAIVANAEQLAVTVEHLSPDAWSRTGTRHGAERTVLELVQGAVHEGNHHLLDVGRGLRSARGR